MESGCGVHVSCEGSCEGGTWSCGAQLFLTGLRAGTFCEHEGSSDVSKTTPRPSVLTFLCFVLGKSFYGESHF